MKSYIPTIVMAVMALIAACVAIIVLAAGHSQPTHTLAPCHLIYTPSMQATTGQAS